MKSRISKKIKAKGTENTKSSVRRLKEMRKAYFWMEENRNLWHEQEWITTKRALRAEAEVKRLKKILVDNGIESD